MSIRIRRYIKQFIVLICLIAIAGVVYAVLHVRNEMKRMAAGSYIASVGGFLQDGITENQMVIEISENLNKEWRFLNESEYTKICEAMSKSYAVDRGGLSYKPDEILFDHWGKHILIAGRKRYGKECEFIVWSRGPDGIFGTGDDIASPRGSLPPEELQERR